DPLGGLANLIVGLARLRFDFAAALPSAAEEPLPLLIADLWMHRPHDPSGHRHPHLEIEKEALSRQGVFALEPATDVEAIRVLRTRISVQRQRRLRIGLLRFLANEFEFLAGPRHFVGSLLVSLIDLEFHFLALPS